MANGRNGNSKSDSGRDSGGFAAIPWAVLDCAAYASLSHPARSLLLELARQFVRDNNGRLLLSRPKLAERGWKSADVIQRAKHELLEAGFIFETVKGHRPNKASWFAVTWRALDKIKGFDHGADRAFNRGAYREGAPMIVVTKLRGYQASNDLDPGKLGASLSPSHGQGRAGIGPPGGQDMGTPCPPDGPVRPTERSSPCPSDGHHLEEPSAGDCRGGDRPPVACSATAVISRFTNSSVSANVAGAP